MTTYEQQRFTGERALYQSRDLSLAYCTFADGESPLKESRDLELDHVLFEWKYPLWYCQHVRMTNSVLFEMARAGIWYSDDLTLEHMTIEAPKTFRRCRGLHLTDAMLPQASETLWHCCEVTLKNVQAKGDYFAMNSSQMEIEDFTLVGNYSFDGAQDVVIRRARLLSRDAFWNCRHVTVVDSFISGEYLGWNSQDVTFINCTIESLQGMCYMDGVTMKNCKLLNTNLAFEYSRVDAQIDSSIDSVKNPIAGRIEAQEIGEVIFDNPEMSQADTQIVLPAQKGDRHAV